MSNKGLYCRLPQCKTCAAGESHYFDDGPWYNLFRWVGCGIALVHHWKLAPDPLEVVYL